MLFFKVINDHLQYLHSPHRACTGSVVEVEASGPNADIIVSKLLCMKTKVNLNSKLPLQFSRRRHWCRVTVYVVKHE